ncbi:MAG: hypothetical protein ACYDH5_18385 [Acidimicrobiales bacterium]
MAAQDFVFTVIFVEWAAEALYEEVAMSRQKVRTGRCPTHGTVEATKAAPAPWPLLVYLPRLLTSVYRGYRCPHCGEKAASAAEGGRR